MSTEKERYFLYAVNPDWQIVRTTIPIALRLTYREALQTHTHTHTHAHTHTHIHIHTHAHTHTHTHMHTHTHTHTQM